MKKAQVTIFVIVGVVILAIIGFLFLLKTNTLQNFLSKESQTSKIVPPQIESINFFVEDCIETTSHDALKVIGQRGGYYQLPREQTFSVPYYFFEGRNLIPTKEKIETEISNYIEDNLPNCIKDFEEFPDFVIQDRKMSITTKIQIDKVILMIDYPIRITKEDLNFQLKEFRQELQIRLNLILYYTRG